MKKILFILLTSCLFKQIQAQDISLANSHNPIKESVNYIVDFLRLDSLLVSSIGFQKGDIKSSKTEGSTIIITTRLLVVRDGKLLTNKKEKMENLSTINKDSVKSIVRIDNKEAIELYGKKAAHGVLLLKTKNN